MSSMQAASDIDYAKSGGKHDCAMQGLNLEAVGVETDRRGFVPVNDKMQVLDSKGKVVPHLYCIGDANGKLLLLVCRMCHS